MESKRKKYIIGAVLFTIAIFLIISLASFRTPDVAKTVSYSDLVSNEVQINNTCGFLGTRAGNFLVSSIGYLNSYVIPICIILLAMSFFQFVSLQKSLHIIKHIFIITVFLSIFSSFVTSETIFWGGYYGKFVELHLKKYLGAVGGFVILFSSFVIYIFSIIELPNIPIFEKLSFEPFKKLANDKILLLKEFFKSKKDKISMPKITKDDEIDELVEEHTEIEEKDDIEDEEKITEEKKTESQSVEEMVRDFKNRKELKKHLESEGIEIGARVENENDLLDDQNTENDFEGNLEDILSMKDVAVIEKKAETEVKNEDITTLKLADSSEKTFENNEVDSTEKLARSATHDSNMMFLEDIKPDEAETTDFEETTYQKPPISIFLPKEDSEDFDSEEYIRVGKILEEKLGEFKVKGEVVDFYVGPIITQFEVKPAPGMKVSKFVNLSEDLALVMKAKAIRVAPIHGKAVIGIEVPNKKPETVNFRAILESEGYQNGNSKLTMALGVDIQGESFVADLSKMPHLLIAGATGSGKSVCLNSLICGFLFNATPDELKMIMIDPKMIELIGYQDIPHLLHPVVIDPSEAAKALQWAVREMERRYRLLSKYSVRNLTSFNKLIKKKRKKNDLEKDEKELPLIVIVVDELADLMMTVSGDIEAPIARLAQMARAVGIHLILATQRPSVDVLTGTIKANFPARIAFQVSSKIDSRTILDSMGAEKLLGRGDMLLKHPTKGKSIRLHGAYISDDEINELVEYTKSQNYEKDDFQLNLKESDDNELDIDMDDENSLLRKAINLVVHTQQASASYLQRKFKIGYPRAGRLIDQMEELNIIGPPQGSKPREVIIDPENLERINIDYSSYDD